MRDLFKRGTRGINYTIAVNKSCEETPHNFATGKLARCLLS
jgi:hypothetical protein